MPKRVIFYVDGFNFYYGAIRGGPNKWLNRERVCRLIRPADDVRRIHYFTALVVGSGRPRQERYLNALATLPTVNVVVGKYKTKRICCRVSACSHGGCRNFDHWEEKRTDVSIATQILDDAYQNECDTFIVVSGDSDLVPPLHRVKERFPGKEIVVYVPTRNATRGAAYELRAAADRHKDFPLAPLAKSQFPSAVPDGKGGFIHKPAEW
jgi:hypothetical protein